ncbi:hypothetical protein [Streptomyces sp. NPDC001594]|uniref:hypothetical protein n=1 Tax=Streptomyces sp. NPDC001594 TaxID=3364590 RepID=UPI0036C3CFDF
MGWKEWEKSKAGPGRRMGRLCGLLVVCAGLGAGCAGGPEPQARWMDGVTTAEVVQRLQVVVPASASDLRSAYRKGLQDDTLLLAFVLPTPDVEGFLARLDPQEPVKAGPKSFAGPEPVAPFAHVGLPEPDSVPGVRTGQVCAPCAEVDFMHAAVARVDEKSSRVYFEAAD